MASTPRYDRVVNGLRGRRMTVHELRGAGPIAVTPAAGRVAAMAFSPHGQNVFWSNPALTGDSPSAPLALGGAGGDRLWFGPEFAWHWDGSPDVETLSNYQVPQAVDPGRYRVDHADHHAIRMSAAATLRDRRDGRSLRFEVRREIRTVAPPLPGGRLPRGVRYNGYSSHHSLRVIRCPRGMSIGLWQLVQVPVGSTLVVPTRGRPRPLQYFNRGSWRARRDHLKWTFQGRANAKIGLDSHQVTGRQAVVRPTERGRALLIVRQFPVMPGMVYADGPSAAQASDQAVQAWDGCGFGEMEHHSPAVGAAPLPSCWADTSLLWAFEGPPGTIKRLMKDLLGVAG